jgi:hypothetical protein
MRIGDYEVIQELGAGGMGIVYKAAGPEGMPWVAIKMIGSSADIRATLHLKDVRRVRAALDMDRRMMLVREARLGSNLRHKNIVRVFDYGQHLGLLYIVMEYLEGWPLHRHIHVQPPLSLQVKIGIVAQMCDALGYAHECGVIHRDVKPANTFVLPDGTVKVLDFGLAAKLAEVFRENGELRGTFNYMAPEIVLRHDQVDARVDIWATGITLYELLTGKSPFTGRSFTETMFKIVNQPLPSLDPGLAEVDEIQRLLGKALAKDRENRYNSAAEFARELRVLQDGLGNANTVADDEAVSERVKTYGSAFVRDRFQFEIGLEEAIGIVSVRSGAIAVRRLVRQLDVFDYAQFLQRWAFLTVFALMFVGYRGDNGFLGSGFYYGMGVNLGLMLVSFLLVGPIKLAMVPLLVLQHLETMPHCRCCKCWMHHRSRWTRFGLTDAAVAHGFSDCVAALEKDLWEDAVKLLGLHGDEYLPPITNSVVSPPIRYHLDFFECQYCKDQCARVTTEDKAEEKWLARVEYAEAYRSRGSGSSDRSWMKRWAHATRTTLEAGRTAGQSTPFREIAIGLVAVTLFFFLGWLLKLLINYPSRVPSYVR